MSADVAETDTYKTTETEFTCVGVVLVLHASQSISCFTQLQGLALSKALMSLADRLSFTAALTATAFYNSALL